MIEVKYIFIDTDNFVFSSLSSRGNHSPDALEKIKKILMLDENNIKLLVPEVVKLEYEKTVEKAFNNNIKNKVGELKSLLNQGLIGYLKKNGLKNYLGQDDISAKLNSVINENNTMKHIGAEFPLHLREPILCKADKIKNNREKGKNKAKKVLNEIMALENSLIIDLTYDIIVEAEKRRIQEKAPSKNGSHKNDQDCYIIETLKMFLQDTSSNSELLFCSNNTKDFANSNNNSNFILHEDIRKDFEKIDVKTKYYESLPDMLEKEFSKRINADEIKATEEIKKSTTQTTNSKGMTLGELLNKLKMFNTKIPNVSSRDFIEDLSFTQFLFLSMFGLIDLKSDEADENFMELDET